MSWVEISRSSRSWSMVSASSTIASRLRVATGRFSHALSSPESSFLRLNSSREPSCLTTMYGMSSIGSYEVRRRPQLTHSRRRRMVAPSRLSRESTTRSRFSEQKGHFMASARRAAGSRGRRGASLLGVQGDVEPQQQLVEVGGVLDVDRQVAHRVDHPMLVVFDLEA